MSIKKLTFAWAAAFIIMFGIGGLLHMVIFKDWFASHPGAMNVARKDVSIHYIWIAIAILALIMSYMYPKGYEGGSKVLEGLKFGLIISILWSLPVSMIVYATTLAVSKSFILMNVILHALEQGLGGIVIALIYGDKPKE